MFLAHHGVKGQEWHKRRYQNEDGSLTELGRIHYGVGERKKLGSREVSDVEDILSSMSKKDRRLINISEKDIKSYSSGSEEWADIVARFIEKDSNNIPVAFLDFQNYDGKLSVTIGTRGGDEFRNKGYASRVSKQGMDWIESNSDVLSKKYSEIVWLPKSQNKGSRRLAEKNGFVLEKSFKNYIPGSSIKYKRSIG